MREHLGYIFAAGVSAGCCCRGEAGSLSPAAGPRQLTQWVARLVLLPPYFIVGVQVSVESEGLLPHLCHVLNVKPSSISF